MEDPVKNALVSMIFAAALLAARPALPADADSLCVNFIGTVGGERLELRSEYALTGSLPLARCDLLSGSRYRIAVGGPGLERRVGTMAFGKGGATGVGGIRIGSALRNAVLPGWGTSHSERRSTAWTDDACLAGAGYVLCTEDREYRHLKNRSDALEGMLSQAASLADRERIQSALHEASRDLRVQNKHRKRIATAAAALYAWQVLDPWFSALPPRLTVENGGKTVRLGTARISGAKGSVLSLLRPGRGQFYEGKTVRGVFFSTAAAAGALAALEYHNRCDRTTARYETCVERFNLSDSVSERERLAGEAASLWDDVSRDRGYRNGAYGALAGLWAWNVIDAFFAGGTADVRSHYSLDAGPQGVSLVYRF